jgi:pimeloyl-ACP methyl ester carboxylesterase
MKVITRYLFLIALVPILACQPQAEDPPAPSKPLLLEVTTTAADGVPLVYDMRGSGDIDLVFIHCWGCDRSFWREQLDYFADLDYRVVSLDLPGHGASGVGRGTWQVADLGADVKAVVEELGLERVVLIGHSMGGPVALYAAQLMPEKVLGIVCIDTLHNAEYEYPPEQFEQIVTSYEQDFAGTMTRMVESAFPEEADPELVEWVLAKSTAANPEATIALLKDFEKLDLKAALSAVKVPIRCINAAPRGPGGAVTAIEINRKYADFDAVLMEDVGHFPQLERPDELNDHLARLLTELTGTSQ